MRHSIRWKLIFSYLGVALVTVLVVSGIIRLTSGQSLMNMIVEQQTAQLKENLQAYYTQNGSLEGFMESLPLAPGEPPGISPQGRPGGQIDALRGVRGLLDAGYRALIPMPGYLIGASVAQGELKQIIPVDVDGATIAYILPDTRSQFSFSAEEELYLKRTTLAIGLAAAAGVLTALAMGLWLSGKLVKPIRLLTEASKGLASGELQQQVPVTSQDELGQLSATFNQMSADLLKADLERKRMTADITHDLSTPLQILSGYIEMLEDHQVSLTPERIEILKTEIGHLRRLVGDLTTLSTVEAGQLEIQLQPLQPAMLMERIYHAYQPIAARQGIALAFDPSSAVPSIIADEGRMLQVLKNLVDNALRYTPEGGQIHLSVEFTEKVHLRVSDSGSGIDAEDLPYVFERFYRADKSRSANAGKMGLGLAICKALVAAQGGVIQAESAGKGQGTSILITFEAQLL